MSKRIDELTTLTLSGEMFVSTIETKQDEKIEYNSRIEREVSELCAYILNQEPKINEHCAFTGRFNFDGSVVGDAFKRGGHKYNQEALSKYYLKPQENLSTMEWQHATADYKKVLEKGIDGIIADTKKSLEIHKDDGEKVEFLRGLYRVAKTLILWAEKCSRRVYDFAKTQENEEAKARLFKLSDSLLRVPRGKPSSFYEAILSIFVCFSADPDSIGTLDRYLSPFYFDDIKNGKLTREEAKDYLKELFLMLQASTPITSPHFTRGGESHFCIGGYLPNGQDSFNELSRLIAESMVELPTYVPQLTLRWTKKLSYDDFYYMMDLERRDPHKRIAFTNDEKRIKCYTEICGIPYERAVSYTTVGCNEPAFLGAITGSTSKGNVLRSVETLFHKKQEKLSNLKTFDEFYKVFENELFSDLNKIYNYDDLYNLERAKDYSYISSLFFNDCIENGKSLTQGGTNFVVASPMLIGITNLIDSLISVKQIVYDWKIVTLSELASALESNWQNHLELRSYILKNVEFFGNDTDTSNEVGKRLFNSFYKFLSGKKNPFGYQYLIGDLLGYNEHHRWFGENTLATPDGRENGALLKFGISQSGGKDRYGLSALLNSIAKVDENAIGCGSTVTNISVDKAIIENDSSFKKLTLMLEAYLKSGGVHFQLTYVSRDDLINAQKDPEAYSSIRVRVTGFSDYFVKLKPSIQNDIIERTEKCH